MASAVNARLKPLFSVILGLDPSIHKSLKLLGTMDPGVKPEDDGRVLGSTTGISPKKRSVQPNEKGPPFPVTPHALRWIGETQCAASGGGAAFGFLISTVRKISPVNRKVKSRNTSAKARIHACCDTTPTSFLIATDAPSRP